MVGARYDPDRRGYRIFVGNLSGVTTHDDLANFFNPFGPIVDVWLASDPPGFGFVVFKNGADADKAVSEKNSTMYLSRTIKVQHARLFRERPTRPNASYDSDTSRSPRSRSPCSRSTSRSRGRSRSKSRSRSTRRWSRSSSRHSYFSRLYGSSRKRSRSSTGSRSRSRSRERSNASPRALSDAESDKRLKSRSRSKSRSLSRTKSRSSHRHYHRRGSSSHRHHHGHRRSRHSRRRRKRQHSHSSSAFDASPASSHHSSPHCSNSRSKRSSSRPKSSSSRRARPKEGCRHCRHCKGRASSVTSNDSTRRVSSSSTRDNGMSQKSERHRRSWRRSEKSNRRSSSLSSSSSSSSASSKSPLPPDRRTTTVNKLDSSGASGHARDRSSAASESAHLVSQTMTGSLSPRNDQDTKPEPKSPSESRKEEPVSSTVVSAPESSARGGASDAASDSLLVSAGYAAITSYTSDDDGAITEMKTNTDSKSASESVGTAASSTVTDDVTPTTSGSNQETCSAGESVSSTMDKAAIGETVSETIPLFPSVSRTQIRFYFTRKAPSFSFAVPLKEETSKAVNETDDPKESGSKENPKAKKEPDLHSFKECRSTAEELRPALQSEDSAEASETCKQPLPSATENDMMEVPEVDLIDISDVCSDVRLSHSLDDIENETEEAMLETNKGKEILQQNKSLLKSVADSSKAAMQTPVTESTDTRCGESELTCSGIAVKLGRKCTETLTPNEISEKTPNNPMEEETLNVSPTYCQDHSKGQRPSDSTSKPDQIDVSPSRSSQQNGIEIDNENNSHHQNIDDRNSPIRCKRSYSQAQPELPSNGDALLEKSESKQRVLVHDTLERVCHKDPLKQKNSPRRSTSPKCSHSLSTCRSRPLLMSPRHSSSCTRLDDDPGFRKRRHKEDDSYHCREMFFNDDRERSEHAFVWSSEHAKRWKLTKRRDYNKHEQTENTFLESSRNLRSSEGTSDHYKSELKEELFSVNSSHLDKKEDQTSKETFHESKETKISRERRHGDRRLHSASSPATHHHAQFNKEDTFRVSSRRSPSAGNRKRRRISSTETSDESSSYTRRKMTRYRFDDRQPVDKSSSHCRSRDRRKRKYSKRSNIMVSSRDYLLLFNTSELEATNSDCDLKIKTDETHSNARKNVSKSPERKNTHTTCMRAPQSSIHIVDKNKNQGQITATVSSSSSSSFVSSSALDVISEGYRETGDQGNKVLAASHSAPTTRACEADSGAETAGGSKGRRALLPTPKPALLPIPSALHGERAAAECPAVQGTRPTLLTSPPHSNYSKLAHIARSGRAGRDPYQSSEHPHPQSVRLKRISANTERENTSVFKPQGNTFQNRNRTSEDKKQMENLGSETFDQEKTPTHDRSPGVADKRHADENSQQNDAVNTKQRTMETPSRDHSDSDSDTERPSKPKLKSKILLVRKSWDVSCQSSDLPADS